MESKHHMDRLGSPKSSLIWDLTTRDCVILESHWTSLTFSLLSGTYLTRFFMRINEENDVEQPTLWWALQKDLPELSEWYYWY